MVFTQQVACLLRRSLRSKETTSHVVIDPEHAIPFACKMFNRFRADQSRGACDNYFAHWAIRKLESFQALSLTENPGDGAIGGSTCAAGNC